MDFDAWDWTFRAWLVRVVDGDTLEVMFDQGFGGRQVERVRLVDVWAREVHGVPKDSEEYRLGTLAKEWVEAWCAQHGGRLVVHTYRSGRDGMRKSFDRYLARVYSPDETDCLNTAIVAAGHATTDKPTSKLVQP